MTSKVPLSERPDTFMPARAPRDERAVRTEGPDRRTDYSGVFDPSRDRRWRDLMEAAAWWRKNR